MAKKNFKILRALSQKGWTQGALVRTAGLDSETRLSRIINGYEQPREDEINKISQSLAQNPDQLGLRASKGGDK